MGTAHDSRRAASGTAWTAANIHQPRARAVESRQLASRDHLQFLSLNTSKVRAKKDSEVNSVTQFSLDRIAALNLVSVSGGAIPEECLSIVRLPCPSTSQGSVSIRSCPPRIQGLRLASHHSVQGETHSAWANVALEVEADRSSVAIIWPRLVAHVLTKEPGT